MEPHVEYHKEGAVRFDKGYKRDGALAGYWEWLRKDGMKLRSGHFENGEQAGEWITYGAQGRKYKITQIKAKSK